jgi:hypothetical protein
MIRNLPVGFPGNPSRDSGDKNSESEIIVYH